MSSGGAPPGTCTTPLRDVSPAELGSVGGAGGVRTRPGSLHPCALRDLPPHARHGPAAAILLQKEGVDDPELLHAISWHTLGSEGFGLLGRALYAADCLEPGRPARKEWREELRSLAPGQLEDILIEIVTSRIDYLFLAGRPVHPRTVGFRESIVNGR